MNTLATYSDSDEDSSLPAASSAGPAASLAARGSAVKRPKLDSAAGINPAPDVNTQDLTTFKYLPDVTTKEITHNVPYAELAKPLAGPINPFSKSNVQRNTLTGFVEEYAISDFTFDTMQRTFNNFGYAADPNGALGSEYVGDMQKMAEMNGATVNDKLKKSNQRKRKPKGDPSKVGEYQGPWAGYEGEEVAGLVGPTEEERAAADKLAEEAKEALGPGGKLQVVEEEPGREKTIFHGKQEFDYMGRTYMHIPTDVGTNLMTSERPDCFLPKKLIHTWAGHTKGVASIKFFPGSGHMLLSAGMDNKVKLWDCYHDRRCLRTFIGHTKALKAIDFTNDGKKFLSASYDKWIKLWDTETGKCVTTFNPRRVPYCIKFNPAGENHQFLAGCQDKKIYQFDCRSGDIVQEYDQHLGAVNTVTFIDENRRFVSTSDDKTIRVWEYGIPVVIKYIAEPSMHSMPAVALDPEKKWLACQSLDNQVLIYSAKDRFRLAPKKVFRGHLVAGYACQPGFSPDGRYLMSGDSEGRLWFWDWKTCKVYKKLKCHSSVVIACEWHPHETSKVATASWDGTI
ncbi:pre-mRNA-processing factor 17, partial [Irineochytrium annulatum]